MVNDPPPGNRGPVSPAPDPRTVLAAERTLLAWLRSAIALMGFGFVVARFGLFLHDLQAQGSLHMRESPGASIALGLALVSVGILVSLLSVWRHHRLLRALDAGERYEDVHRGRLPVLIGLLLALVGGAIFIYLLRI
jgi:Predicted membrane protein